MLMGRPVERPELSADEAEKLKVMEDEGALSIPAKIVLRRAAGLRQREVAAQLGVSPMTVTKWTRRFHLMRLLAFDHQPRRGRKPVPEEKACEVLAATGSIRQIAANTGLSPATVQRIRAAADSGHGGRPGGLKKTSFKSQPDEAEASRQQRNVALTVRHLGKLWDEAQKAPQLCHRLGVLEFIRPETLEGFRVGEVPSLANYEKLGLFTPRRRRTLLNQIQFTMRLDDPILVWIGSIENFEPRIWVVDGLARLSAVAMIKSEYPNTFKTIPVQLVRGTSDAAIAESIRRRLRPGERVRSVTRQALYHLHRQLLGDFWRLGEALGMYIKAESETASRLRKLSPKEALRELREIVEPSLKREFNEHAVGEGTDQASAGEPIPYLQAMADLEESLESDDLP